MEGQMEEANPTSNNRKRSHEVSPPPTLPSPPSSGREREEDDDDITRANTKRNRRIEVISESSSAVPMTPTRTRKRLRFSDPGPVVERGESSNGITGLTPAISRTCMTENHAYSDCQTPTSRKRKSAPSDHDGVVWDPVISSKNRDNFPSLVQFTPLRQKIDDRTQRRLWRQGLSEERNKIERENWDLKKAVAHIQALEKELENYKGVHNAPAVNSEEFDTIMIDNSTMYDEPLVSNSPIFRSQDAFDQPGVLNTSRNPVGDASAQVSMTDTRMELELQKLSSDLAEAKKEKENLFKEWQGLKSAEDGTASALFSELLSQSAPTAENITQKIIPMLESALSKACNAINAVENTRVGLSNMGFAGSSIDDILQQVRESFRSARMELERILPGETALGLDDGKATLEALVSRLKQIANAFVSERKRAQNMSDMRSALQQQFRATLRDLELEKKRVDSLRESLENSSADMLHNRQLVQSLEAIIRQHEMTIKRHIDSSQEYIRENANYLSIIQDLEKKNIDLEKKKTDLENMYSKKEESLTIWISDSLREVEELLNKISQHEAVLREKDVHLMASDAQIRALQDQITEFEAERKQHLKDLIMQKQELDEASAALSEANKEVEKSRLLKDGLKTQYDEEVKARERLEESLQKILQEGQNTLRRERTRARARSENWKNLSSDIISDEIEPKFTPPGSEPPTSYNRDMAEVGRVNWQLTPDNIMSDDSESSIDLPESGPSTPCSRRSLSNVRVGRGKDRRSLDSGLGFWSVDDLFEDIGSPSGQKELAEPEIDSGAADVQ